MKKTMLGFKAGMLVYGLLALWAVLTLKGKFLALALIVVFAAALKTLVNHFREKIGD